MRKFLLDIAISKKTSVTIGDKAKKPPFVVVEHDEDRKNYVLIFEKDRESPTLMKKQKTTNFI